MQTLVDIVRGYDIYTNGSGWIVNADRTNQDPDTNATVTWQVEL